MSRWMTVMLEEVRRKAAERQSEREEHERRGADKDKRGRPAEDADATDGRDGSDDR